MSAAVEADGVRKLYGDLVAVDDLTFSVEPGHILGVLGPNVAFSVLVSVLTYLTATNKVLNFLE